MNNKAKFCSNCGHELNEGNKFCPSCGKEVSEIKSNYKANVVENEDTTVEQPTKLQTREVKKRKIGVLEGFLIFSALMSFLGVILKGFFTFADVSLYKILTDSSNLMSYVENAQDYMNGSSGNVSSDIQAVAYLLVLMPLIIVVLTFIESKISATIAFLLSIVELGFMVTALMHIEENLGYFSEIIEKSSNIFGMPYILFILGTIGMFIFGLLVLFRGEVWNLFSEVWIIVFLLTHRTMYFGLGILYSIVSPMKHYEFDYEQYKIRMYISLITVVVMIILLFFKSKLIRKIQFYIMSFILLDYVGFLIINMYNPFEKGASIFIYVVIPLIVTVIVAYLRYKGEKYGLKINYPSTRGKMVLNKIGEILGSVTLAALLSLILQMATPLKVFI